MTNEQICTQFMQDQYTDEKLAALLAHAEDGKLSYVSALAFSFLGSSVDDLHDQRCREAIIPLIKAEIARRDAIRESNQRLLQEDRPETELMVRAGCFE